MVAVNLINTIGALEVGSVIAVFLFGIVTLQCHTYYTRFRDDPWSFKAMVAITWLLELGHTIGVAYEVFHSTIVLFGQPEKLIRFPALGAVTGIGGLITMVVQCFFSFRVWKIIPRPYHLLGLVCIAIAVIRCIGSLYLTVKAVEAENVTNYSITFHWLIEVLLAVGAGVDVVIAVTMLCYLYQRRGEGLSRVGRVIDRLVAYTIRTGLLTSIAAVVMLICFQVMPNNLIWLALYTFLAKLYSNALLSSLNGRDGLRQEISSSSSGHPRSGPKSFDRETMGAIRTSGHHQPISIEMKTTMKSAREESKVGFHQQEPDPEMMLPSSDRFQIARV